MDARTIAPRPRTLHSTTQRIPTTLGTAFITIAADEAGGPFEAFVNVGKAGSDTFAVAEAMGRLVSLILRMPSSLTRQERAAQIVAQLSRVGGALHPIHALPDALAVALGEQIKLNAEAPKDVLATEAQPAAPTTQPAETPAALRSVQAAKLPPGEQARFLQILKMNPGQGAIQVTELKPEMKQAVQALGSALKEAPALHAYYEATARLEADRTATGLLDELQRVQSDIRTRQVKGGVSQADLAHLRQLQNDVQSNRTITAFIQAQQLASLALPEVNQEISELLGVDFATLGRVTTC